MGCERLSDGIDNRFLSWIFVLLWILKEEIGDNISGDTILRKWAVDVVMPGKTDMGVRFTLPRPI